MRVRQVTDGIWLRVELIGSPQCLILLIMNYLSSEPGHFNSFEIASERCFSTVGQQSFFLMTQNFYSSSQALTRKGRVLFFTTEKVPGKIRYPKQQKELQDFWYVKYLYSVQTFEQSKLFMYW